ncbi:MAG: prepilin peptidase [Clostridiales bacterium]|nr:prepilin peptidase [Clostridiales bacterium]
MDATYLDALRICILLAVVFRAVWTDLRSGKVGNRAIAAALACGLAINIAGALAQSAAGLLLSFAAGLLLPFAALLPLFAIRALGAGDIKLLMAAGWIMGLRFSARALACSLLAGGAIALAAAIANRRLAYGMANLWRYAKACFTLRALLPYGDMPRAGASAAGASASAKSTSGVAAPVAGTPGGPAAKARADGARAAGPGGGTIKFTLAILAGTVASLAMLCAERMAG